MKNGLSSLDLRARADLDPFIVAAKHRAVPAARRLQRTEPHAEGRQHARQRVDQHCLDTECVGNEASMLPAETLGQTPSGLRSLQDVHAVTSGDLGPASPSGVLCPALRLGRRLRLARFLFSTFLGSFCLSAIRPE
jgi:hypothetical protein